MGNVFLSFFFFFPGNTTDLRAFLSGTVQNMACTSVLHNRPLPYFQRKQVKYQRNGKQWYNLKT